MEGGATQKPIPPIMSALIVLGFAVLCLFLYRRSEAKKNAWRKKRFGQNSSGRFNLSIGGHIQRRKTLGQVSSARDHKQHTTYSRLRAHSD